MSVRPFLHRSFLGGRTSVPRFARQASGTATVRLTRPSVWIAAALTLALTVTLVPAAGSVAADLPEYLQLDKTIEGLAHRDLVPGDEFTYRIEVRCSEQDCIDAQFVDALPADLAGFEVVAFSTEPDVATIARTMTWSDTETANPPTVIGSDSTFTVDFEQPFPQGSTRAGLPVGRTFFTSLTLRVPENLTPSSPINGKLISNNAVVTAQNSAPAAGSASITVNVAETFDVSVGKTWTPQSASFNPGSGSTIQLTVGNGSNIPVTALSLQEPKTAADGATTLDASNPFTIANFAGFGATTLPEGANGVRVDAYVFDGTAWSWTTGVVGSTYELPQNVDPADVGGVRFIFVGDAIAPAASASIPIEVTQRATDRTGADLSTAPHTVTNVVESFAAIGERTTPIREASANHQVIPAALGAEVAKNILPARIPAGNSAVATITAKNTSAVPVAELRIDDLGYFTDNVTFGGFSKGITWPENTASAVVTYLNLDGTSQSVVFADGATPAAPAKAISGFEIVFTAGESGIQPGEQAQPVFLISSSHAATGDNATLATSNTAVATVTASNGSTAQAQDDAPLVVVTPTIEVGLDKTLSPSVAVEPGERVVAKLQSTIDSRSDFIKPTRIVVEDSWGSTAPADGFWNAFRLESVQSTQVPAGTSLAIQVQKTDGTWADLSVSWPAQEGPHIVGLTTAQLSAALPTGVTLASLTGIRFVFTNPATFPANAILAPYVGFSAQSTLRTGGPVSADNVASTYTNGASTVGTGVTEDGVEVIGDATDTGEASVIVRPGVGPVGIDKQWDRGSVDAQSGQEPHTVLNWRVSPGFTSVSIADPGAVPASPADTVFDAFDLRALSPVASSNTPFSNGWYLTYDTVSEVWLFQDGAWQLIEPADGSWTTNGAFDGYVLSTEESAATTGVRVVLVPHDAARTAAKETGSDPYAPEPGTGVASSSSNRSFDLAWQLRNKTRSDGAWVTATTGYNGLLNASAVRNDADLTATRADGSSERDGDSDTIVIIDQPPMVTLSKTVSPTTPLIVPRPGTVDQQGYPTARFVLTAKNGSTARASYVRVTDEASCTDLTLATCQSDGTSAGSQGDPFSGASVSDLDGRVFNRLNLTDVTIAASIPSEVDLAQSTAWLLRFQGGLYVAEETTAAAANDLSAVDLADVVAISVTFQGANPEVTGGTISSSNALTVTLDTQVRATLRHSGAAQVIAVNDDSAAVNRAFAQSYDPVLASTVKTGDVGDATVRLSRGVLDVTATKTITDGTIVRPQAGELQHVTLGASQGTGSTVSPSSVVLEDQADSTEFWNAFDFVGLEGVTVPSGADQVQLAVYGAFGGGALGWTTGAPVAAGSPLDVPVAAGEYASIQGIRVTFSKADGSLFSPSIPAPRWSADLRFTVQLRQDLRASGDPVAFPGAATNSVTAQAIRSDFSSEKKTATDDIAWTDGSHELQINKLANEGRRTVAAGSNVPWDITVRNSGDGYLTLDEVRDTLPAGLLYLGSVAPVYATSDGGTLSTDVEFTQGAQGDLLFSWPEDGRVMQPGETFTIRILLELQPSAPNSRITNTVVATTEESLSRCSNIVQGSGTTGNWEADATTCGTTDFVTPTTGSNLLVLKGVRGSLAGAVNPADASQECLPTVLGSYFRQPCIANSVIGGEDDWLLHVTNAGTTNIERAVLFDQLPVEGDKFLINAGASRGSTFRPELVAESLKIEGLPAGTTVLIETTTSAEACVGTWAQLPASVPCAQNDAVWTIAGEDTEWDKVSGLRVSLDFTTSLLGSLKPAQSVNVTYSSVNTVQSVANPGGAQNAIPATDSVAWNQFGITYKEEGFANSKKIAPDQVGVHLLFGSIRIDKEIDGAAAAYAPEEFLFDVTCTVGGDELVFGADALQTLEVALNEANGYSHTITGIPLGAECSVREQGEVGQFGEATRDPAGAVTVQVEATDDGVTVPAAQIATITNSYSFVGLSVTKRVDTEATTGNFGPFTFSLICTTPDGRAVMFGDATSTSFTIADGETYSAPADTIPARASCVVTESDSSDADDIVFTGDNVVASGTGSAEVTLGTQNAEVTVVNAYDAGVLTVAKVVDGAGAASYGSGPFTFGVTCTYRGDTIEDTTFDLEAHGTRTLGTYPAGSVCEVREIASGGATASVLTPAGGVVTIVGAEELAAEPIDGAAIGAVTVTATNTFDTGALVIEKVRVGDGVDTLGAGPFTAQTTCTWIKDGERETIALPNGGSVLLSDKNGYEATITNLILGAECTVTETDDGGATRSEVGPNGGVVTIVGDETDPAVVTITNTFILPPTVIPPSNDPLAITGSKLGVIVPLGAVLLLLLGAVALLIQRRRVDHQGRAL